MEDRIERQAIIRASHDKVWHLVSRPGWWLPGSAADPARGLGRVTVICSADRSYISFRWASAFGGLTPLPGNSTLVEFYVRPVGEEIGVTVVESGFSSLDLSEALRESEREGNAGGWQYEMANLRTRAEQVPAEQARAGRVPAEQARAGRVPAEQARAGRVPAEQARAGQVPVRQAWAERGQ
jgi:hypothetical protein